MVYFFRLESEYEVLLTARRDSIRTTNTNKNYKRDGCASPADKKSPITVYAKSRFFFMLITNPWSS